MSGLPSAELRTAVVCEPIRTPVGRFGGQFKDVTALELATTVIEQLVARTALPGAAVDDVIFGQSYPSMEAPAIARVAALDAGLPITAAGYSLDRRCGSGLQAVLNAAMQVQTGVSDVVIAGGVDSMSQAPFYSTEGRFDPEAERTLHDSLGRGRVTVGGRFHPTPDGTIETAENLRREYGISREDQDAFSLRSHQRAVAAQGSGVFAEEIVAIRGIDRDEHPRADTSLEALARLKPILLSKDTESTVTAGNAAGQNDAAAACIVTTPERAAELGLTPLVRLVSWGVGGVEPERMGVGPVPATERALSRAGLTLADLDLIELNEAFAAQVLAVLRDWNLDPEDARLNPHGGGISIGHPIGATGVRILAGLARELHRTGGRYGLETMCIGGGQGLAAVFERV